MGGKRISLLTNHLYKNEIYSQMNCYMIFEKGCIIHTFIIPWSNSYIVTYQGKK